MITVYIDMDGVVCDWHKEIGDREFNKVWFNEFIQSGGFERLQPLGDLDELKAMMQDTRLTGVTFTFLSSAGGVDEDHAPLVSAQKRKWLDDNGFEAYHLICVQHKGLKKRFASPTSILIDDTHSNCVDFVEGHGQSIKVDSYVGFAAIEHIPQVARCFIKITEIYHGSYYK